MNQPEETLWRDGVPVSARFDDPYYSLENGLAETEHVFLHGNRLTERLDAPLHIAELGFGTGLNLLATWGLWERGPQQPLRFTSFEAFPMDAPTRRAALKAFPMLADKATRLTRALTDKGGPVELAAGLTLEVIVGDARNSLPDWSGSADAWFLDGFSPAKNPELWHEDLMKAVFGHTRPGGTLATYTAAGHVRRALADAGFIVTRQPGFGRKRHMTTGVRP